MAFKIPTNRQRKESVFDLKVSGVAVPQICEQLNLGKSTVYRILGEFDPKAEYRQKVNTDLATHASEVIELYKAGVGSPTIAQKFRCNPDTVINLLRNNGVEIRPMGGFSPAVKYSIEIIDLYKSGLGSVSISRKLNIHDRAVLKVLRRNGVKIRPLKHPSVRSRSERDRLFLKHKIDIESRARWYSYRFRDLNLSLDEFKQFAYVEALRAAELWADDGRGTFRTYVHNWIHKAMKGFVSRELKHRHSEFIENPDSFNQHD